MAGYGGWNGDVGRAAVKTSSACKKRKLSGVIIMLSVATTTPFSFRVGHSGKHVRTVIISHEIAVLVGFQSLTRAAAGLGCGLTQYTVFFKNLANFLVVKATTMRTY